MLPIDALFKSTTFKCTCCGAAAWWGDDDRLHSECVCHASFMETCERRGKCLEHCKCLDCKRRRIGGLHRINYTGIHHLYFQGAIKTLCNRTLPGERPGIVRAPAAKLIGRECQRCATLFSMGIGTSA